MKNMAIFTPFLIILLPITLLNEVFAMSRRRLRLNASIQGVLF